MAYDINFNEEKNQLLKITRGVCFEDIILAIKSGQLLADIEHHNRKLINQRIYVVRMKQYIYAVPYVINQKKKEIFLKTIYPSRVLTKMYLEK